MDWMKLKSGSDVRGTAMGENALLTPHVAQCLGMAFFFVLWLRRIISLCLR